MTLPDIWLNETGIFRSYLERCPRDCD